MPANLFKQRNHYYLYSCNYSIGELLNANNEISFMHFYIYLRQELKNIFENDSKIATINCKNMENKETTFNIDNEFLGLEGLDNFLNYLIEQTELKEVLLIVDKEIDLIAIKEIHKNQCATIDHINYYVGNLFLNQLTLLAKRIFEELDMRFDKYARDERIASIDKSNFINSWAFKFRMQRESANTYNIFRFERQISYFAKGENLDKTRVSGRAVKNDELLWDWVLTLNNNRYNFYNEILFLLEKQNSTFLEKLYLESKYQLSLIHSSERQYFLHELCIALIESKYVTDNSLTQIQFINDFFAFFGEKPKKIGYHRDKILSRTDMAGIYLDKIESAIQEASNKYKKIKHRNKGH